MKQLRLVGRRKIAKLITPPTALEASPDPARASRPPLRGGAEYRDNEIAQLKAQLQEAQQLSRERLRDALRRYEELYNFAPISLITLDSRGMILDLNERAARLLAFPADWLRERPLLAFVARDDVPRFLNLLSRLRRTPVQETAAIDLFVERHVVPVELWMGSSLRDEQVIYRLAILDLTE